MRIARFSLILIALSVCGSPLDSLGQVIGGNTAPSIVINEIMASNGKTLRDYRGQYEDWIELYNPGSSPVDVGGMYMTDDLTNPRKWRIPTTFPLVTTIGADGYLLVWADGDVNDSGVYSPHYTELHAPFSLSKDGEAVGLFASDGATGVDSVVFGPQVTDVSLGRFPNGTGSWQFVSPTPYASNSGANADIVSDVEFSRERGFCDTPFSLRLSTKTVGASIYYTLDGRNPVNASGQAAGILYTGAIPISGTTCVRAAAVEPNWIASQTRTASYLFLSDIILQSATPTDFPMSWGSTHVDYGMDPRVVNATPTIKDDLKTIPSVSIVMNKADLFDAGTGIYANLSGHGDAWERATSIEWIDPTTGENFQVNTGIRIHGSPYGRSTSVGKHAFRILFKSAYGPSELVYPLFKDGDVDHFDVLVLRSIWNYSWFGDSSTRSRADYLRDLFCRDTVRDMGNLSTRGRPVHVYIDGLYWGLYILSERTADSFLADHLGGDKEDYDLIQGDETVFAATGDMDAWNAMMNLAVSKDMSSAENYQAIQQYLDVPNMIDYMLMIYLVGSRDAPTFLNSDSRPHNMFAARSRNPAGPFIFLPWDVEWALENGTENRVTVVGGANGPHYLVSRLKANPEFKFLMADRIYRFFFNSEALTSSACKARYGLLSQEIDRAIVGEAARWGDASGTSYTRDNWVAEVNRLLNTYFPSRTDTVLSQLKAAGFYPTASPPDLYVDGRLMHGGRCSPGAQLSMQNTNTSTSTIWYTLDGTDPRTPGSNSDAEVTLVPENASKKVLVPTATVSTSWRSSTTFSDSTWISVTNSPGGVGYDRILDDTANFLPLISLNIESQMYNKNTSCLIRIPFTLASSDIGTYSGLRLNVRCDDGFVAYLNGMEVARKNCTTSSPVWNTKANAAANDSEAVTLVTWDITTYMQYLRSGQNLLAIQGLNESTTSPDFLISAELNGTRKADFGGAPSTTAVAYTSPVSLSASAGVKARVQSGGIWSALNEAVYAVGPVAQNLRISELMYHPLDPNTEYIELTNIGADKINLNLVKFSKGIDFVFPNTELAPHAYVLVVEDPVAFKAKYGTSLPVAGQYKGQLDNAGERIRLEDAFGQVIEDFSYSDGWFKLTDGPGFSLTVKTAVVTDPNGFGDKSLWRPSAYNGGSPGYDDSGLVPPLGAVVINELMANPKKGDCDWIELYNTTDQAIDIGGWFLSDDANEPTRYEIAAGTTIPAKGYIVFTASQHFDEPVDPGCHTPFGLGKDGETVHLQSGSGGVVTGYVQEESFDATETGVSLGRCQKSTGSYNFVAMTAPTPGAANAAPKVGPIVISEIMYHPASVPDAEYVELLNISDVAVTLWRADVNVPWQFTSDSGIEMLLPSDSPITLAAGQRLVLTRNVEAFTQQFGALADVQILAWGTGWLSDSGDKIQLDKPTNDGNWIRVDRVVYSDGLHPDFGQSSDPWPTAAAGLGQSLTRTNPNAYGNDPANWHAAAPTPGKN